MILAILTRYFWRDKCFLGLAANFDYQPCVSLFFGKVLLKIYKNRAVMHPTVMKGKSNVFGRLSMYPFSCKDFTRALPFLPSDSTGLLFSKESMSFRRSKNFSPAAANPAMTPACSFSLCATYIMALFASVSGPFWVSPRGF